MKKIAIILSLVMVLSMFAGGSISAMADNTDANDTPTSGGTYYEKPVTLTYFTWDYADRPESTEYWIQGCKDNFNIVIELQNIPTENYAATLRTRMSANDVPDLVKVHGIYADYSSGDGQFSKDMFKDLSDLENMKNFNDDVLQGVAVNGEVLYVPISASTEGVLYNKQVFADNGIEIPTNFDEMIEVMETLKANGITPLAGSFGEAWSTQIIPHIAMDSYVSVNDFDIGAKLYNANDNTSSITYASLGDAAVKAINLGKEWVDAGYFSDDPAGSDASAACQMLATGKTAMFITGSWEYAAVAGFCEDVNNIGFFALPLNAAGEKTIIPTSMSEGITINAQGKNVEAAEIALNYYLSDEVQQVIIDETGFIPTNVHCVSSQPFTNEVSNAMHSCITSSKGLFGGGAYWLPRGGSFDLKVETQSVLCGIKTAEQFIADLDAFIAKSVS